MTLHNYKTIIVIAYLAQDECIINIDKIRTNQIKILF